MTSIHHSRFTDSDLLVDRNYWATFKDPLISWHAELAPPAELGMDRVLDFTRRVLEAAEREEVMRVLEVPPAWRFERREGWTWYDFVRSRYEQLGEIHLFPSGGGPTHQPGGRFRLPARMAFYRGDDIVVEDVEDPGLLLRALHQTDEYVGRYSVSPIVIDGYSRTGEDWVRNYPPDKLHITLGLFTDIWFPRIVGLNAEEPPDDRPGLAHLYPARGRDGLMDNSAIARRHTPRLNRFIETLRDAVIGLGGTWGFDKAETHYNYRSMVHDGGINLDPPVADA